MSSLGIQFKSANSFSQGTIFKFRIYLLEKGSFCCVRMCKLPLRRTTGSGQQDPALHFQPNQDPIFHHQSAAQPHNACPGESHLSISEASPLPSGVLCVLTSLQVEHSSMKQPTLKQPDYFWKHYCSYHCKRGRTAMRLRKKKGSGGRVAVSV